MKKRRLREMVAFYPGVNQSRAEKQLGVKNIDYYDQPSFDADYSNDEAAVGSYARNQPKGKGTLREGDIVISNSLQLATMVQSRNAGKVLSLNFTKVEFQSEKLDKGYFLYLFNGYKDIQRQKERELQGSGFAQRIPIQSLEGLVVPVVDLPTQKNIGKIYIETLQIQSKTSKYLDLLQKFVGSIIEDNLKEK